LDGLHSQSVVAEEDLLVKIHSDIELDVPRLNDIDIAKGAGIQGGRDDSSWLSSLSRA